MVALDLFLTFAKIGLFTFGGGYAMIALIEDICVKKKQWITVGYKQKGLSGAVAATVGMVLPSFCIIFLISRFLDNFLEIPWIAHAFMGIRAAVGILILDAGIGMIRKMQKKPLPKVIMLCAFAAMLVIDLFAVRISSITLMLIAALVSLAVFAVKKDGGKEAAAK